MPPADTQSSRRRILEAARNEFSDKGFDGARVDRIARIAGINKAMIYYHFQSKAHLYEAVIEEFVEPLGEFLGSVLDEERDLAGLLTALSRYYVAFFESSEGFAPIVLREMATGGEHIREILGGMLASAGVADRIRGLMREEAAAGEIRTLDPAHTFVSFLGMNLIYLFFSPILNPVWEIQDEDDFRRSRPDAVVDLFLNGIRAR